VTTETVCAGTGDAPVLSHKRYSYNGLGKVAEAEAAIGLKNTGFSLYTYGLVDDPAYDALVAVETTATYTYLCDGLVSSETRENTYGTAEFPSPDQHIYYSYDPLGKATLERWESGATPYEKTWRYDAAGRVMWEKVGSGEEVRPTAYVYDGAGRVTAKIVPQAADEGLAGRTYMREYSDAERKARETDPEGRSTTRTYDDLGREVITEGPALAYFNNT
jgi:hypothetical protein